MKNKSILAALLFISPCISAHASEISNEVHITSSNINSNEAVLKIKNDNRLPIKLPNGNYSSQKEIAYKVNRNGTYDFLISNKDGSVSVISHTITQLRKELLVTKNPNVELSLTAQDSLSGVGHMKFKNEEGGSWTGYEAYKTTKDWTLQGGDGIKSVYAMFKDNAGNESIQVYDQIYLDRTAPEISKFVINNNDPYTKERGVTLNISAIDEFSDIDFVYISNDNKTWTKHSYSTSIPWTLTAGAGEKTVYMKLSDNLGNTSDVVFDKILFDDVKPTGGVTINNGASITNSRNVKLNINFDDIHSKVKRVSIIEKDNVYTFPTVPSSPTTLDWTLSHGSTGKVTLEIEDNAGNIFRTDSNVITIATLEVTSFRLTNVVNPSIFTPENPYKVLTWDFEPQPMKAGADISFDINYKLDLDESTNAAINGDYIVEIVGEGYSKALTATYDESIVNGFKATLTLPEDVPDGAKIYLSSKVKATLTNSHETFTNEAFFPGKGEKALIGYIEGNIKEDVIFNEIR